MRKIGKLYHNSIKILPDETFKDNLPLNKSVLIPLIFQDEALGFGVSLRYVIFRAPGGCGKTILAILISMDEAILTKNTRKHLFVAPTIEINENFCNFQGQKIIILHKGKERTWVVPQENKFNSDNKLSIKGLKAFFLSDSKGYLYNERYLTGPYATATHSGLVKIWNTLTDTEKRIALKNLTLHIDECHHSKSNPLDSTRLGEFVRDVCEINEPTCNLNLYTATFFRTDRGKIVPDSLKHKFKKWSILLQQYLSIINIEKFNFRFTHYKKDPLEQIIGYMLEHKDQKHIVILPDMKNRFRDKNTLTKYLNRFCEIFQPSRVLDLVTEKTQKENKALLRKNHEGFDVVISCKIFHEGYDWPPASVLHNTSYSISQVRFTQIMFRIFRKYPNKKEIWLYIYVPPPQETNNLQELYSNKLNLFLTSIIMSEFCLAIKIPLIPTAPLYKDKRSYTRLYEIMDEEIYTDLKRTIITSFDYNREKDNPEKIELLLEVISEDFYKHVEQYLTLKDFILAVKTLFIRLIRLAQNKSIEDINIDLIREEGFDKIWKIEKIGCIVFGTKKSLTQKDLIELKDIMEKALLIDIEKEGRVLEEKLTQDHIVKRVLIQKPLQEITDIVGQWITFEIPPKKVIKPVIKGEYSNHVRVLEQNELYLKVAIYKGKIVIENKRITLIVNPGLILKDREEKFIYNDNFWRSVYIPSRVTPSNTAPGIILKYFLFEGNVFKGRKKAPYIIRKIPYDWIKYTL